MEGAQCFIEVYKVVGDTETFNCDCADIEWYSKYLGDTKAHEFLETIAVWYIKPKVSS